MSGVARIVRPSSVHRRVFLGDSAITLARTRGSHSKPPGRAEIAAGGGTSREHTLLPERGATQPHAQPAVHIQTRLPHPSSTCSPSRRSHFLSRAPPRWQLREHSPPPLPIAPRDCRKTEAQPSPIAVRGADLILLIVTFRFTSRRRRDHTRASKKRADGRYARRADGRHAFPMASTSTVSRQRSHIPQNGRLKM